MLAKPARNFPVRTYTRIQTSEMLPSHPTGSDEPQKLPGCIAEAPIFLLHRIEGRPQLLAPRFREKVHCWYGNQVMSGSRNAHPRGDPSDPFRKPRLF